MNYTKHLEKIKIHIIKTGSKFKLILITRFLVTFLTLNIKKFE